MYEENEMVENEALESNFNNDYEEVEQGVDNPVLVQEQEEIEQEQEVDKVEVAFGKRLSQERAKIEKEYAPIMDFITAEADRFGMSKEEYLSALQEERRREQEEREKEKYSNLEAEEIEALKWAKENKARYQQEERAKNQARELVEKYPEVKSIKDIPKPAIDLADKYGVPLVEAYEMFKPNRQALEQQTLKQLKQIQNSNVGSLNNSTTEPIKSIGDMSSKDFNDLVEKVKRGQINNI